MREIEMKPLDGEATRADEKARKVATWRGSAAHVDEEARRIPGRARILSCAVRLFTADTIRMAAPTALRAGSFAGMTFLAGESGRLAAQPHFGSRGRVGGARGAVQPTR
jgi:hypothetical protein